MASGPSKKRARPEPEPDDGGLGGLYDFLPPPDPKKEEEAAAKAKEDEERKKKPKLPPGDPSRVIFLDIDGVLLPSGSVEMIFVDGVALPLRETKEKDFRLTAFANLRTIVEKTGATLVLSSEWRRTEEMKSSIQRVLLTQDCPPIKDITPLFKPSPKLVEQKFDPAIIWCERRAREIGQYLKDHKEIKSWVAIDDLDFSWADAFKQFTTPLIKHRSVCTNAKHCITEKDMAEAIRILQVAPVVLDEELAMDTARQLTDEMLSKCSRLMQ
ncbi:unnamed protein product [Polarella glacialis]|nr:unnamed protein product [Polarella glacialis]CAE8624243.1 unnamed protein product [Polarella glacialis]CAE8688524.1 unnamed protein product [Polarella glacialis]